MVRALARACHPLPTVAVTCFIGSLAWAMGWPPSRLGGLLTVVLLGQLSVGWSNDAHDADLDRASNRQDKPVARGQVRAGQLWAAAVAALAVSMAGSWLVAGWLGGTFHVLALLAAWAYNLRFSRTSWSWVPYAVAFGCVPAFLGFGLDDQPPALWLVVVAAIIGVAGHLSNASGDIESDALAGQGGLAVRMGEQRSSAMCWVLLAAACGLLVSVGIIESAGAGVAGAILVGAGYLGGLAWARRGRGRRRDFHAVLAVTAVDLVALILVVRGFA